MTSAPGATIDGVVRDEAGRPVGDAAILVATAPVPMPDIAALTSADGTFTLAAPAPGAYTIMATCDGYEPARVAVDVAAGRRRTELVIVLRR